MALNCSTKTSGITPVEYAAFVIVELIPIIKLLNKTKILRNIRGS